MILHILILTLIFTTSLTISQNVDTTYRFQCPIENATIVDIKKHKYSMGNPIHNITFVSTNEDKVIAIEEGTVVKFFDIIHKGVLIKKENFVFVYMGLIKITLKKNDIVRKGDEIGIAGKNSAENKFQVKIQIWNGMNKLDPKNIIFDCSKN